MVLCLVFIDGTAVNTGTKGVVVRMFELSLNWFTCQLHTSDLPLRHLFAHLDGHMLGPISFSAPIVKDLPGCEMQQLVEFGCVQCDLPLTLPDDLSTDKKYLYDMCIAISVG